MEIKKYSLTEKTVSYRGRVLHQIKAQKDFGDVKKGDSGGYVESESNLSQYGSCWVYDAKSNVVPVQFACICGGARVVDDANIRSRAHIEGRAVISGNACISGTAKIRDNAQVTDSAVVTDNFVVGGNATVSGNTQLRALVTADKKTRSGKVGGNVNLTGGCYKTDMTIDDSTISQLLQSDVCDTKDAVIAVTSSVNDLEVEVASDSFLDRELGDGKAWAAKSQSDPQLVVSQEEQKDFVPATLAEVALALSEVSDYAIQNSASSSAFCTALDSPPKVCSEPKVSENTPKYELTPESFIAKDLKGNDVTLRRIRALKDFGGVRSGSLGGFIEKEDNLSQSGKSWVAREAQVYGISKVFGNAIVCGNSIIEDSDVCENARVADSAISNHCCIKGHAEIKKSSVIDSYCIVSGNCEVDDSTVTNNVLVEGDLRLMSKSVLRNYLHVSNSISILSGSVIEGTCYDSGRVEVRDLCSSMICMHLTVNPVAAGKKQPILCHNKRSDENK